MASDQEPEQVQPSAAPSTGSFGTYDPASVKPAASQPEDGTQTLVDDDGNVLAPFDPKFVEPLVGLLYVGALTRTFEWLGHEFVIHTLSSAETLAIAEVVKPWQSTVAGNRAFVLASVAMAITTVDGQELPVPIGDTRGDTYAWAHQRFAYVRENWFAYTVDRVYSEIQVLDAEVEKVVGALEKAYGSTTGIFTRGSSDTFDALTVSES